MTDSKPFIVHCGKCKHEWTGFYVPMPVDDVSKVMKNAYCPKCAAGPNQIYCGPAPDMSMPLTHPQNVFKKREKVNMSDDLVKRLRVRAEFTGPYSALWDEAADRIKKLEALLDEEAFSQTLFDAVVNQRNRANARIEKLEAALSLAQDWIENRASHAGDLCTSNQCVCGKAIVLFNARKALEGKDD